MKLFKPQSQNPHSHIETEVNPFVHTGLTSQSRELYVSGLKFDKGDLWQRVELRGGA